MMALKMFAVRFLVVWCFLPGPNLAFSEEPQITNTSPNLPNIWRDQVYEAEKFSPSLSVDPLEFSKYTDWITVYDAEPDFLRRLNGPEGVIWEKMGYSSFPSKSTLTLKDGWLSIYHRSQTYLSHWLSVDLKQFCRPFIRDDLSNWKATARNGTVYVTASTMDDGILLALDFAQGNVTVVTSQGVHTLRSGLTNADTKTWVFLSHGFVGQAPITDMAIFDDGTDRFLAVLRKAKSLSLLDRDFRPVGSISSDQHSEFMNVAISSRGELYLVEHLDGTGDRILVTYDAKGKLAKYKESAQDTRDQLFDAAYEFEGTLPSQANSNGPKIVHRILPVRTIHSIHIETDQIPSSHISELKRRVFFGTPTGIFLIEDVPNNPQYPLLHFLSGERETEWAEFSVHGKVIFNEGHAGIVGASGWSDDNFLYLQTMPKLKSFSVGAWVHLEEPEGTGNLIFDNRHNQQAGWASGFSEHMLFTYMNLHSVTTQAVAPGAWHHFVAVNDGNTLTMFLNGTPVAASPSGKLIRSVGLAIGKGLGVDKRHLHASTRVFLPFIADYPLSELAIKRIHDRELPLLESGFRLDRFDLGTYLAVRIKPLKPWQQLVAVASALSSELASAIWLVRPNLQALFLALAFALFLGLWGRDLPRAYLTILGFVMIATFLSYSLGGGLTQPFRSDNYIAFNLFSGLSLTTDDLLRAARFEMFGHRRIHPLAHLIMFTQYKAFGMNHVFYHLFQFALHFLNVGLLFFFLVRLTNDYRGAVLGACLFTAFYSQFDMINWTYHSFVVISVGLVLTALHMVLTYVQKGRYVHLILTFVCLFLAQLVYEANAFMTLAVSLFFGTLLIKHRARLGPSRFRSVALSFALGLGITYAIYGSLVLHEAIRMNMAAASEKAAAIQPADLLDIDTLRHAIHDTLLFILDPVLAKASGFPSGLIFKDIVYQTSVGPQHGLIGFILALVASCGILITLRTTREELPFLAVFLVTLLIFVFIVALGRSISAPPNYVRSQSHYTYFPNMLLVIILVLLLKTKLRESRKWSAFIGGTVFLVCLLNLNQIQVNTQATSDHLDELSGLISKVENFRDKSAGNDHRTLFVDFPVHQINSTFNLGADILLDKYFERDGFLTKRIREASHILTKDQEIIPNPSYSPQPDTGKAFTVEFTTQRHRPQFTKDFTVVGSLASGLSIGFNAEGRLFVQQSDAKGAEPIRRLVSSNQFENFNFYHVIVQFSPPSLCIIINGQVTDVFAPMELDARDLTQSGSLLGEFYRGAEEVFFSTALHVTLGDVRYKIHNVQTGNSIPINWQPPWIDVQRVKY